MTDPLGRETKIEIVNAAIASEAIDRWAAGEEIADIATDPDFLKSSGELFGTALSAEDIAAAEEAAGPELLEWLADGVEAQLTALEGDPEAARQFMTKGLLNMMESQAAKELE